MSKERHIDLRDHEVRQVLKTGSLLVIRPLRPQPTMHRCGKDILWGHERLGGQFGEHVFPSCFVKLAPDFFDQPGDRLWVREAFVHIPATYAYEASASTPVASERTYYRADIEEKPVPGWSPPMHMPRERSRINVEVLNVQIQPVQGISEKEAQEAGFDKDACARIFDAAAGRTRLRDARWLETEDGCSYNDGDMYCSDCAEKIARKNKRLRLCGWGEAAEDDGPALCTECGAPILVSLTEYGIESELRMHEGEDDKTYWPCRGASARVAHMIAAGIGDLREDHLGRLAQIGFATYWDSFYAQCGLGWAANPWVSLTSCRKVG